MNIKEAKQELVNTVRAYTRKREDGSYVIPLERQRPMLLMGPPGIGKTAILAQVAEECGVGLVAYTMTHHTRQSAIGLPLISHKNFQGKEYAVTEYTMSEIIASVYRCMEETGLSEGILFLDEINCVSETLAPTMLQFLQKKTFGTHKIPDGWIIAAAGNPQEYNRSARELDLVTRDRVRMLPIEADFSVWREYAWEHGLHSSSLAWLKLHPERFYSLHMEGEESTFVTARGWEDLSEMIFSYEEMGIPVDELLIEQFLQEPETARAFAGGYRMYRACRERYDLSGILEGSNDGRELAGLLREASPDARMFVAHELLAGWMALLRSWSEERQSGVRLKEAVGLIGSLCEQGQTPEQILTARRDALKIRQEAGVLSADACRKEQLLEERLEREVYQAQAETCPGRVSFRELLQKSADAAQAQEKNGRKKILDALERGFAFAEDAFGEGPELLLLVTDLSGSRDGSAFLMEEDCEAYRKHSERLLFAGREAELRREAAAWNR